MKKLVAIVSMFAFMAAAVSTQAMSSAAGSGSSSGGSSGGSRSSSNNGSKIVPSPIISDPAPVIGSDTDPAPSPIGDIRTPKPCPPNPSIGSVSDSLTQPCPKPTPAPAPSGDPRVPVPCTAKPCRITPVVPSHGGHGNNGTQIRAVNGWLLATVPAPLPYGDGTLLRDIESKQIYIVTNASVRPIRNLAQLAVFNGRARADVMPSVISLYRLDNANYSYFKNNTLVRDASNHKIYVADKGRLRAVRSLTELKTNFKGKAIKNLDPKVIANY